MKKQLWSITRFLIKQLKIFFQLKFIKYHHHCKHHPPFCSMNTNFVAHNMNKKNKENLYISPFSSKQKTKRPKAVKQSWTYSLNCFQNKEALPFHGTDKSQVKKGKYIFRDIQKKSVW